MCIRDSNKGSDAIQALKQGKADAVVIDEQPALAFVKANPDLTILEEEFANEDYAICVAKGNSLTAKLNEAIEVLMADGTIQKLSLIHIFMLHPLLNLLS